MILDIQTIPNGLMLYGVERHFTATYLPTSIMLHNTYQVCVELDEQLTIFDCRDTTIDGSFYANSTLFQAALGL
jgi:hypothetical protein